MKKSILKFIMILLITTSCGFKVVNQFEEINFSIANITSSGDKKVSYIIKNKLSFKLGSKKEKSINLNINTKKNKTIKEKNINNEITKYQISITANIETIESNSTNIKTFTVQEIGSYSVAKQYSQSSSNEKKLTKTLSESLANKILNQLVVIFE